MSYVLIMMWFGMSTLTTGKAALSVEFNDLASCQAAAAEVKRQNSPDVLFCAPKGIKK